MNTVMWVLAGGILGWVSYSYMSLNEARGAILSAVIGAIGGVAGGTLIAPMFTAAAAAPGDFSASALFFAAAMACGSLYAAHLVKSRWDV
jgi:uncharacterized membrane protein YeaQ/YmgE (transglycosylase-associated protein family)